MAAAEGVGEEIACAADRPPVRGMASWYEYVIGTGRRAVPLAAGRLDLQERGRRKHRVERI